MKTADTDSLSRREFLRLAGLGIAATTLLSGCALLPSTPTPLPTEPPVPLKRQIGQMLMLGFRGLTVDDDHPIVRDIRDYHLGGVVLFDYDIPRQSPVRNIQSPEQVQALIQGLQAASSTPLLVAIDQEGGHVCRLKEELGFPATVSHQYLGTMDDRALTREQAGTIARTLKQVGINLNLAPVVDLNANPDNPVIGQLERSFSADAEIVTRHALEFIEAHHEQGVCCTLKHFPGHGSSSQDSHLDLVDVSETWSRTELEPYSAIIQRGRADAIMTAHVFNANLDPEYPATLSRPTIHGILRQELGYDGVVISDDMQMGAISGHYGFENAVEAAIRAGVDILVFADNAVQAQEAGLVARTINLVIQLVQAGRISRARIGKSYWRIQQLKSRIERPDAFW